MELPLYGETQSIRTCPVIAVARFLKGLPVRAVWCEMRQPDNTWSRPRLTLATRAVVEIYAEHFGLRVRGACGPKQDQHLQC